MIVTDLSNSFNPCPKNTIKKEKKKTRIKQKSSKLAKLERQRDKDLDPHEIYGGSNRKRSIQHKFVKLICPNCHSNEAIINQLRIDTQKEYEKYHTREEFIKLIGKSYLD